MVGYVHIPQKWENHVIARNAILVVMRSRVVADYLPICLSSEENGSVQVHTAERVS